MMQTEQACATTTINCNSRCDAARANLREAQTILAKLIGSYPSDTEKVREPSNRMEELELWLENLVSESRYIVDQLAKLAERIG